MPRILVVDDEDFVRQLMQDILAMSGHEVRGAKNAKEAREILDQERFELILCDINMPGESGLDFIRHVLKNVPDTAAMMVTGLSDPMVAEVALDMGVYDYVLKPFDRNTVLIAVANALRRRQLELDNRAYRTRLEEMVAERTARLHESLLDVRKALEGSVQAMALTITMRDPYTAGHQQRVAKLSRAIGRRMGLPGERLDALFMAAMIHDIGKISIPAEILSKPGSISRIEYDLIKCHSQVGYDILKNIEYPWPIATIVLQHHERMNGTGYPGGLKGEEILLEARIIAVGDVVEAMASHRPYRPAMGIGQALQEIKGKRGLLYDPEAVDACLLVLEGKDLDLDHLE